MTMLMLFAVASFFFPIARSASAWSSRVGPGIAGDEARVLAQPPPPDVTTNNGEIILTYRWHEGDLPVIVTIKHTNTGHGALKMVGRPDELYIRLYFNMDCEAWMSQGNPETTCPAHPNLIAGIEDSDGNVLTFDAGEGGFLQGSWAMAAGAITGWNPDTSGDYRLGASLGSGNEVFETYISVEIVEPTAVPTVAEPTQATPVSATEVPTEPEPEIEFGLDPWVPLFAGLLGAGGALWYLLSSGLLGPLSGGGAVSPQPAAQTTQPADDYWKIMEELEESVQKADQMTEDLQKEVDAERREHFESDKKHYQEIADYWDKKGDQAEWFEWWGKAIKFGADRGVDILAGLTGPFGGPMKDFYTFTTNFAESVSKGEGAVWGITKGLYEVGFGKVCDGAHDRIEITSDKVAIVSGTVLDKKKISRWLIPTQNMGGASVSQVAVATILDKVTRSDIGKSALNTAIGFAEAETKKLIEKKMSEIIKKYTQGSDKDLKVENRIPPEVLEKIVKQFKAK